MSGATDSGMVKTMGWVMGIIAVFAIIIGIFANMLAGDSGAGDPAVMRNALMQRIQPVASVRTVAEESAGGTAVAAVASAPKTGAELVNGACAACHAAGVAGAPKLDDDAAWASRRELGLEALVASVINGKGSMPARGGSTYSDDEITEAVKHMAMFESASDDQSSAVEPAAQEDTASAEAAEESAPAEDTAVAAVAESASDVAGSLMGAVMGQVPDNLTDSIKTTVDSVCAGCHIAGVANAPKFGDVAAWQPRIDKGMDALVSSVANGLNVMPPRGGSTLTDDELPIAIQYMLSK